MSTTSAVGESALRCSSLPARPAPPAPSLPATSTMAAIALACAILMLYAGRHLSFFFDEWDFILGRRGESVATYLAPHNGHLVLFGVVVYKLLFAIVGLNHYWPYQMVNLALHILCGWLIYVLARRRVGPWVGLVPATALLFMGSAYEDLLWPFQMGFLGSVAGGLGALALLDRDGDRADGASCALLVWSLSASAVGIPFLLAAGAMLLVQRSDWRRLWVMVAPALLFAVWYLGWGTSETPTVNGVLGAPQYIASAASAASAGIFGLSASYGPPLAVAAMLVAGFALRARAGRPPPLAIAAGVGAVAFWGLTAIARADVADPAASRYLYIGAVFLLLVVADAAATFRAGRTTLILLGLLLLGAVIANLGLLRAGERSFRAVDDNVKASLEAVQLASPVVSADFVPEPQRAPQVTAGPFLAAARELGSPALTLGQLENAPWSIRDATDPVLERAERLAPLPATSVSGVRPLIVEAIGFGRLVRRGNCDQVTPAGPDDVFDLRIPDGTSLLVAPHPGDAVFVYLRRFAPTFTPPPFTQVGSTEAIRFPDDRATSLPWKVRLTSSARFTACSS